MKIRIPKVVENQKFRQKYISNTICHLPCIDVFLHLLQAIFDLLTTEDNELQETRGVKDLILN